MLKIHVKIETMIGQFHPAKPLMTIRDTGFEGLKMKNFDQSYSYAKIISF
jgi:hypothetical protein